MSEKQWVKIDVFQKSLDVYVLPSSKIFQLENNQTGITQLVQLLKEIKAELIVLEAIRGIEIDTAVKLHEAGFSVAVINSRQAQNFAKAIGISAKNDAIDAKMLVHFVDAIRLQVKQISDEFCRQLGYLVQRRRHLCDIITAEKNYRRGKAESVKASIDEYIKWLEEQLQEIESQIKGEIAFNLDWQQKLQLFSSFSRIGEGVCETFPMRNKNIEGGSSISSWPELDTLSYKSISYLVYFLFARVAPINN